MSKENTGNLTKIFLSSSLHGFPSHVHPGSAAVVSSTLSVEGFLYTIEQFFRARDALGGIEVAHPLQLEIAVASFPSTWQL